MENQELDPKLILALALSQTVSSFQTSNNKAIQSASTESVPQRSSLFYDLQNKKGYSKDTISQSFFLITTLSQETESNKLEQLIESTDLIHKLWINFFFNEMNKDSLVCNAALQFGKLGLKFIELSYKRAGYLLTQNEDANLESKLDLLLYNLFSSFLLSEKVLDLITKPVSLI